MGWRGQAAREEAEREREREFINSLQPRDRLQLRIWQLSGVGILVCVVALIVLFVVEARGAPIKPGAIEARPDDGHRDNRRTSGEQISRSFRGQPQNAT